MKMNFDGALFTSKRKASIRIILWNFNGNCHTIRAKSRNICSSLVAESKTTLLELQTTKVMGVKKLIGEGDSKTIIEAMKENLEDCPT